MCDHGLSGVDVDRASLMQDAQHAIKDIWKLIRFRTLTRLLPSGRAAHMRDACSLRVAIPTPDIFVDDLWLRPSRFYPCRLRDQSWHSRLSFRAGLGGVGNTRVYLDQEPH